VPFVVVDTSVSLPATLSPQGMMRRFWVVLALGALTHEVEHGQLEAVCVIGAPAFDPAKVPVLTTDRKDDPILYTALIAEADLLISDDKHLVPDGHEEPWEHEDRLVVALKFHTLAAERLGDLSWAEIDGSWLAVAHVRG
jgi:predicted nucleic acid-binding protein